MTTARPAPAVIDSILARTRGPERRAALSALQPAWNHWHHQFESDPRSIRKAPVGIAVELAATCDDTSILDTCKQADKRVAVQRQIDARLTELTANNATVAPRPSAKLAAMLNRPAAEVANEIMDGKHSHHMTLSWLNAVDRTNLPDALEAAWNHGTRSTRFRADLSYYVSVVVTALNNDLDNIAIRWWDATTDNGTRRQLCIGVVLAWDTDITSATLRWAKHTGTGTSFSSRAAANRLTITADAGHWAANHGDASVMFAAIATSDIDADHVIAWGKIANHLEVSEWPHYARHLDVFEAAIEVLATATETRNYPQINFAKLLNRWPDANETTRLHIASMLEQHHLFAWVTGTWGVSSTDAERPKLLSASRGRYPDVGFRVLEKLCAPLEPNDPDAQRRHQLAADIVANYHGASINALFAHAGPAGGGVADIAVEVLTDGLGDNPARWACAMGLLTNWDDSLAQLIEVAHLLADDSDTSQAA